MVSLIDAEVITVRVIVLAMLLLFCDGTSVSKSLAALHNHHQTDRPTMYHGGRPRTVPPTHSRFSLLTVMS